MNNTPAPITTANLLANIDALHADASRHQKLQEQVKALLEQFDPPVAPPSIPAWHPGEAGKQLLKQVMAFLEQFDSPSNTFALPAWHPSEAESASDFGTSHKIRRIEGRQGEATDIVAQLRATKIGRFYVTRLKPHPSLRGVVIWFWRNAFPIYVKHISIISRNKKAKRWHLLIKLADYTRSRGLTATQLVSAVVVETPPPRVFPESNQGYLESPHDRYNAPAIYVTSINKGMTYGGSNLILTQDGVICHDLYDFKRDYTSEELHGRALIDPLSSRIRWMFHDEAPERLPAAAAFVDACAANYAHWLTEVLPRIAAFCAAEQFNGVPIIVNDGLHKNIMESLYLVAGSEHEIITLNIGRAVDVDELYITSIAGYVPFERRTNKLSDHSHGIFNPHAFELIRVRVALFSENQPEQDWPEKIYLRRNSGTRKVTNAAELEKLLIDQGYVIVEPEKLTFLQQVQLFSHAKIIVGSSGAAMANIVFAPSSTKIYILIGKLPNTSYWYWQNIACASGKNINYVFGELAPSLELGIHADFVVNLNSLALAVE